MARLGDICLLITDGSHNPPAGITHSEYLMLSSKNIDDNNITFNDPRYLSEADFKQEDRRTNIQSNDLLMTIVGTIGRVAIVPDTLEKICVQRSVAVLKPNPDMVFNRFLMYQLQSMRSDLEQQARGVAQKGIYLKQVSNLSIALPSLNEQRKIAAVLDKISDLIAKRRQQLDKLDLLIKSKFVEMFGDPVGNPKGWDMLSFKQAGVRLSDGPFGSNLKSEHYVEEGVRVIRLGNIGVGTFIDNDKAFISPDHYERLKKYTCRAGEIVIGTLGEPNLRACIVPDSVEYAINKADCVHYIPKSEILKPRFVCQYINCPETLQLVSGMIHGQTRSRISSGQIAKMPIFIPPIKLQEEFSVFVEQVEKTKTSIDQSLEKLETLKKALMQEYFG